VGGRGDPRVRHRGRLPPRAPHPDAPRRRRPGRGEREGDLRERGDRARLRHHAEADDRDRPPHRRAPLEPRVRPGVRPHVGHPRRLGDLAPVVRGADLVRGGRRVWRDARARGDQVRRAQHHLRGERRDRLPRRPPLADAPRGRHAHARRDARGRAVRERHPPVHDQRRGDARLRQRQRAARLRGRRPAHGQGAAPRGGAGLPEGAGEAARLPGPRRRPDAGRDGGVAVRRREQPRARLRRDRLAAAAHAQHRRARPARLGDVLALQTSPAG
jgi:hypothetical protein